MPEVHQRMSLYKRVSQVRDAAEVAKLARGDPRPLRGLPARGGGAARLRRAAAARGGARRDPGRTSARRRSTCAWPRRPRWRAGPASPPCAPGRGPASRPPGVLRAPLPPGRPAPSAALEGRALRRAWRRAVARASPATGLPIIGCSCGLTTVIPLLRHGVLAAVAARRRLPGCCRGRTVDGSRPPHPRRPDRAAQRVRAPRAGGRGPGRRPLDPDGAAALLEPYLEERVLVLEARRRGLVAAGDGAGEGERVRAAAAARTRCSPGVSLTEAEVDAHCRDHAHEFDAPERIRLRQILVPTPNEARDVVRRLQEGPQELRRSWPRPARGRRRPARAAHGRLQPRAAPGRAGASRLRPGRRGDERRRGEPARVPRAAGGRAPGRARGRPAGVPEAARADALPPRSPRPASANSSRASWPGPR